MRIRVPIELLEYPLHLLVVRLNHLDCISYQTQEFPIIIMRRIAALVFPRSKVLDLLARIFNLSQAQRGGRAFQEMAERGERCEVVFFSEIEKKGIRLVL